MDRGIAVRVPGRWRGRCFAARCEGSADGPASRVQLCGSDARSQGGSPMTPRRLAPLLVASLVLGVGLGGFIDGIVLHQLLQWHSMLSSVVPPTDLPAAKYNMMWDGAFHM